MSSNAVIAFHNPHCATSRDTIGLIRNAGIEPAVIEYLRDPPAGEQLAEMFAAAEISVRAALRGIGTACHGLGLGNPALSDAQLLEMMIGHPILIDRCFVITSCGSRLCRPAERVLDILTQPQRGFFAKENGEVVIAANGQRVQTRVR